MSDIQDIIHTTTVKAYESGVKHEQERIVKLLDSLVQVTSEDLREQICKNDALCEAIALIKGEK
jgi:hypothetical protein